MFHNNKQDETERRWKCASCTIFYDLFCFLRARGNLRHRRWNDYKTGTGYHWCAGCSRYQFLSSCTVLAMTAYSVLRSKMSGNSQIDTAIGIPLAIGGAAGGIAGRQIFSALAGASTNLSQVGAVQAACLVVITLGTLLYTVYKTKIPSCRFHNQLLCLIIGGFLGVLSSFLGIGGGPINLVVLFFFFSMPTKAAAENSLYIILFSQIASLCTSLFTGSIPEFPWPILLVMVAGGIIGGMAGRSINRNISEKTVDKLFIGLMIIMIVMNGYNMVQFLR